MGYVLLFAPFVAAQLMSAAPLASYLIAWAGSFWILFLVWTGRVKELPSDLTVSEQVLRPVFLTHALFAGYTFISSVFFVIDLHGFYYLSQVSDLPASQSVLSQVAQAQRYYVLAHGAVATGMLAAMDYRNSGAWAIRPFKNPSGFLLVLSLVALVVSKGVGGGLGQIGGRLIQLSLVASVLALALAFPTRRLGALTAAAAVYVVNLGAAFSSGWKEEVLVMVLLLAVFAYPYARRLVLFVTPVVLIALITILPAFVNIVRELSWGGDASGEEAAAVAYETLRGGEIDLGESTWTFLTQRSSEIGLFVQHIDAMEQTDDPFYGLQIAEQAALSVIPRALWSGKPWTENLVMERVYENGVVSANSSVSAKPQYVVDGYLSGGATGVLLAGLLFGLLASLASRASERWFGGYLWGSGLVYTTMFAIFWKGNSFEFFFNNVFWGFALLVPLFVVGRWAGVIVRPEEVVAGETAAEASELYSPSRMRAFWSPG